MGEWDVEMRHEGLVVARQRSTAEWIAGGDFLLLHGETAVADEAPQVWHDNAPTSFAVVIGPDDRKGNYAYVYADSRDVHRVQEMTLDRNEWHIFGQAGPQFFQRFAGVIAADGGRIDARWERSGDGSEWELDFEATYTRR